MIETSSRGFTDAGAIEGQYGRHECGQGTYIVRAVPGDAVLHDLGDSAPTDRRHRRPAGHGLDQDETEWFGRHDRIDERRRPAEQQVSLAQAHRPLVNDGSAVHERSDFGSKVALVVVLGTSDHEAHARQTSKAYGLHHALALEDAPEEQEIVPGGRPKRKGIDVDAVGNHGDVRAALEESLLVRS